MPKKTRSAKTGYNSDVSDEEWAFCAPYLALMKEDAAQREYTSRSVFNAVRYLVRTGCPWRDLPNDLPPWSAVHQQAQRFCGVAQAGSKQAALRPWRMICEKCCGCSRRKPWIRRR